MEVSAGFVNAIVERMWDHINVAAEAVVKETVEPQFKQMLPGPLSSLHFEKLDLGVVPIKVENVVFHPKDDEEQDGGIRFDLDVVWDGNCDIELKATGVSFGVESIKLFGRMSVLLRPLTNVIPVVSSVQCAFINPPDVSLDFTGLADVADFSMLDGKVRKVINDVIASLLVLPNRLFVKIDPANDYLKSYYPPAGILRITAVEGRGFKVQKSFLRKDIPDVYLQIEFCSNPTWTTSTIKDEKSPIWNECSDFILSDLGQNIKIRAFDQDLDSDDDLGSAMVVVGDVLKEEDGTLEVELKDKEGNGNGSFITLRCQKCRLNSEDMSSFEPPEGQGKHMLCGILTVLVTRACNLPLEKEEAASCVKVTYGKTEFLTPVVSNCPGVDALNPAYDSSVVIPISTGMTDDWPAGSVVFDLMNKKDVLGTVVISIGDILGSPNNEIIAMREIGDQGASLEVRVALSGMTFV